MGESKNYVPIIPDENKELRKRIEKMVKATRSTKAYLCKRVFQLGLSEMEKEIQAGRA